MSEVRDISRRASQITIVDSKGEKRTKTKTPKLQKKKTPKHTKKKIRFPNKIKNEKNKKLLASKLLHGAHSFPSASVRQYDAISRPCERMSTIAGYYRDFSRDRRRADCVRRTSTSRRLRPRGFYHRNPFESFRRRFGRKRENEKKFESGTRSFTPSK